MFNIGEVEIHLEKEDFSSTGLKKIEALYAHALGLDLSVDITYIHPSPLFIATVDMSKMQWKDNT